MLEREAEQLAQWLQEYLSHQLSQSGVRVQVPIGGDRDPHFFPLVRIIGSLAGMQKALLLVAGSMGEVQKASLPAGSHGLTLRKYDEEVFMLSEIVFPSQFWNDESLQTVGPNEVNQNFPGIGRHIADEKLCLFTKGGLKCNLLLVGGLLGLYSAQQLLGKLVNIEAVNSITLVDLGTRPGNPDFLTGKYMVLVAGYPWSSD